MKTAWRVMKFGGTTVGTPSRLAQAIALIREAQLGGPVAVVVSAMGDTTDHLLAACRSVHAGNADEALRIVSEIEAEARRVVRETASILDVPVIEPDMLEIARAVLSPLRVALEGAAPARLTTASFSDYVVSFGERLSAPLVALLLRLAGASAIPVDARAWMMTDDAFGHALPDTEETFARLRALSVEWGDAVPVVTGFIGATKEGRTTTLGRNGSDFTAALLAAGLSASELTTWTDVPGVMTADPSLVADAYLVSHLSHEEAFELAHLGLRMFHQRAMELLRDARIPLRIRNSLAPDQPGTRIDAGAAPDPNRPTSVVSRENLALLDLEYADAARGLRVNERVLGALSLVDVPVLLTVQAPVGRSMSVLVHGADADRAEEALSRELEEELKEGAIAPLRRYAPVTQLTLLAEAMGRGPNVAGRLFRSMGEVGVNIRAIAQGGNCRSISFIVSEEESALAVRTVHSAFNLAHTQVSVLLLGKGIVGSQLLTQMASQREFLRREHGVLLELVGIAGSTGALFDDAGIELSSVRERFEAEKEPIEMEKLLERVRRLPLPVLVDCTAADSMEELYLEAFARGIHVVAANKKPLAIDWEKRNELIASARRHHRHYLYETTVGASLPVIETLKDLVRTGDRVRLIEGSFSGTLGYLANELMAGIPLSRAVSRARELGYTEPHPRDDLAGLDVARKALILARELGMPLSMDDVEVEPFVPRELLVEDSVEAFVAALSELDASIAARIDGLRAEGQLLRYIARIDPEAARGKKLVVGPVALHKEHPAARLRGTEAFVAFTTERYSDYPLIVQGAGAGGAVTAAGVLTDILKIAQSLRGR